MATRVQSSNVLAGRSVEEDCRVEGDGARVIGEWSPGAVVRRGPVPSAAPAAVPVTWVVGAVLSVRHWGGSLGSGGHWVQGAQSGGGGGGRGVLHRARGAKWHLCGGVGFGVQCRWQRNEASQNGAVK